MAKMIPSHISAETRSQGERRVFELLRGDPDTKGWTILHSLNLTRTAKWQFGEIDFVVIIPGQGIVCLEIKGGGVACHSGQWSSIDRNGNYHSLGKSPFEQARESMFALKRAIENHFGFGDETRCPIGYGVVFPDVACPPVTPEFERWEVIDHHDLNEPIARHIMKVASNRLREFQTRRSVRLPTAPQAKTIAGFLRPNFEMVVTKEVVLGRIDEKIIGLTEEQYNILDMYEGNPRCLFRGTAGTGKTTLAVEFARRAARDGKNVLIICFNRLLAEWISDQVDGEGIVARNWHEVAREFILASSVKDDFLEEEREVFKSNDDKRIGNFFSETYHLYAGEALQEHIAREGTPFDCLVMDEAQDVLGDENVVEFLDYSLKGGLSEGQWAIFGDFTPHQALFASSPDPDEILGNYDDRFAKANLTLNCRNTPQIAEEISKVSGLDVKCRIDAEMGMGVRRKRWNTPSRLVKHLDDELEQLVNRGGVQIADIIILAPNRLTKSPLAEVKHLGGYPIVDITQRDIKIDDPCVRFSTIHAFKGLESSVVMLIYDQKQSNDWMKSLLYVGMSRAKGLLVLLAE